MALPDRPSGEQAVPIEQNRDSTVEKPSTNPEVSGTGTGDAEQSASSPAPEQPLSFAASILAAMNETEEQAELPGVERTPAKEEPAPEPEKEEAESEPAPKPVVMSEDQWPESAKKRVAEEVAKRKDRTDKLTAAEGRVEALETELKTLRGELKSAQRPVTAGDPLYDVHDEASLSKAERQFEQLLEFAETHRDGAEDVLVGKDAQGNDVRQDFDEAGITKLKLISEKALRKDIPLRRQYLAAREQLDARAKEIYPQLAEDSSQWSKEAAQLLRIVPELERVPDCLVWIGHALAGRDAMVAQLAGKPNGETTVQSDTMKIVESSKVKKAPAVPTDRSLTRHREADVETARKRMQENPDSEEAMESYIGAELARGRAARHRPVIVP